MTTLDDLLDVPDECRVESHQARRLITKFGGESNMAKLLSEFTGRPVARSTIYRWTWPKSKGGTGGFVPARKWRTLMRLARQEGILLTPADIALGRDD